MAKSYRTAFIRISASNNTQKGIKVYSMNDIKTTIEEWSEKTNFTYWVIEHEPDQDSDNVHFHVVLKFGSPQPFTNLKAKFPYGDIQSARSVKNCVQYLVHLNDMSKQQYEWSDVVTNCADMTRYKVKSEAQNEVTIKSIMERIDRGEIREYNQFECIPIELWAKYKTRIENALTFYRERICMDKNRELQVVFFTGNTGTGKTTFAKKYCTTLKKSFCISSSANDPMQDYKGEDVLILDDLRDSDFSFTDLLKILDNHTKSTVRSRYHNKAFIGDMIIITSYKPLEAWYKEVPQESRLQLFRRIQTIFDFDMETIKTFEYDQDLREYKYVGSAPNMPMLSIKKKRKMVTDMLGAMGLELSDEVQERFEELTDAEWEQIDMDSDPFKK